MTARTARFDVSILRYLETVAALRLPVLIAFATLFGFQLAINVAPHARLNWLAPAGTGAILLWLLTAWVMAWWRWPEGARLADVVRAFRIGGVGAASRDELRAVFWKRNGLLLITLLALLAIPHWVGLLAAVVTAYLLLLLPVMERPPYRHVMLSLAAMAIAMPAGSVLGHEGLGVVPDLTGGRMLASISALTLAWIIAKQAIKTEREPLFWPERWSMGWALVALPLTLLPQAWVPLATFLAACVVVPTVSMFVLLLRLLDFSKQTRDSLVRRDLRSQLAASRSSELKPEAVLRESDGYFRLCAPAFAVINPGRRQPSEAPNGVLTWIGEGNDEMLPEAVGECIAIRNLGTEVSGLHAFPDHALQSARHALVAALPDFKLNDLRKLREELSDPWNVRLLSPRSDVPLAKLPWEHHELLLVPITWLGTFVYPPGGGIHDARGIPCHFDEVEVRIDIVPHLVDELRRSSEVSGASLETLRLLQWNYRRILPAVYERLYGALIAEMRNYRLPLLFELDEEEVTGCPDAAGADGAKIIGKGTLERLLRRVNERLAAGLPDPIARFVQVRVLKLSQPDTTILAASQREAVKVLRATGKTLARRQQKRLEELEVWLKRELEVSGEMAHFLALQTLRPEIFKAADECQKQLNQMLDQAGTKLEPNVSAVAVAAIMDGTEMLREAGKVELEKMTDALKVIRAAFNDEPVERSTTQSQEDRPPSAAERPTA
jgi:hypothetical protein